MCALEFLSELTLSWALPFNCPIKLSNYSQAWYYIFSHNTIILGLINLILNNKPILLLYTHYLQYSDQDARTAGLSNHVTIKCILKTFCRVPSQQQTYINWQHQIWEGSVGPVCHESRHELRVSCKKRKQPIAQNYFSNKIYRGVSITHGPRLLAVALVESETICPEFVEAEQPKGSRGKTREYFLP